jgi:hypothetical protein
MNKKELFLAIGAILPAFLILACSFGSVLPSTTPNITPAIPPTQTVTPLPVSTRVDTPIPENILQARAFGDPILQALNTLPPVLLPPFFKDDFSQITGWAWDEPGKVEITDGVMRVYGTGGGSIYHYQLMEKLNFVVEFDMRAISSASMGVFYHKNFLEIDSQEGIWQITLNCCEKISGSAPILLPGQVNHITLIVKGVQNALYINEEPVAYFEDTGTSTYPFNSVALSFWSSESSTSILQGEFDNFVFWDITNFP